MVKKMKEVRILLKKFAQQTDIYSTIYSVASLALLLTINSSNDKNTQLSTAMCTITLQRYLGVFKKKASHILNIRSTFCRKYA